MDEDERERTHLDWLARNMPLIASAMGGATYVAIRLAGHGNGKAVLVGAIMFGFVISIWKLRVWFGVRGAITAMGSLAVLLWALQKNGWL
ncbi:hypothetical protein [Stappia sp. MMSF_3263]|uniref:hypothetical protein n=1 Tax=Stappia sp. MMSF_3263 TaxID=3046693 RepID=UPI00273E1CC1|nr:hypothetical protein [Stappia sp. MMSF_3263]